MPPGGPPTEEERALLTEQLRPDPDVHGFGFTVREGVWVVGVALALGDHRARPDRFAGYRVVYEHSGPFHAD